MKRRSDTTARGTIVQGLIANHFIEAMNRTYDAGLTPPSDQEILAIAGVENPNPGGEPTYYDISRFVIVPEPGAATTGLLAAAIVCSLLGYLRLHGTISTR